jgi:hypothetical protein
MFVRIKSNKGGSKSVILVRGERVPGKKHSMLRIVKNFGQATDEASLETLKQKANSYKEQLNNDVNNAKELKISTSSDIKSCRSYCAGFVDVYGQEFNSLFKNIKLVGSKNLTRLRDMVIMRIAEPASKLKTASLAKRHNLECKVNNTYRMMDQITPSMIEEIKQTVYNKTKELLIEQKKKCQCIILRPYYCIF